MRVRTVLGVLLAVNVLWAAAFVGYVRREPVPVIRPSAAAVEPVRMQPTNVAAQPVTNPAPVAESRTNITNAAAVAVSAPTNPPVHSPKTMASTGKKFGWRDVTNETYLDYIANLRSIGCPEKQVRNIVVADVNELFDHRRLEHAVRTDSQWWRAETIMGVLPMQNVSHANFDEERRNLLTKLLGEDWEDSIKLPSLNGTAVNLTGPVLGALPAETWNTVQEICQRSIDRHQAYLTARMNDGIGSDNLEMARMREMTRSDLTKVLTPEQLEEFLLRYSHNSSKLRQDMRGIELTPDEFRRIFRAIDPIEHQIQLDYGGPEALSQKQREQLESQRDLAIREVLSPQRYQQFLATKDPLYRQAQMLAASYGLNNKAIQPLYDMQKALEVKRSQVNQNLTLTPEQRAQAMQSIGIEQQQHLQRLLGDVNYRN